jgi:predicted aldo/keto reductase-like oxidoreductase
MEYRLLGTTGLKVSTLGLGVEHLKRQSSKYIAEVVQRALSGGINYFDLVWSLPHVIEGVSQGISDEKNIHLAVHLGSSYRNGKYVRAKGVKKSEETFRETLDRLDTNTVSIINVHYLKGLKQWEEVSKPNNILDLAVRLRDEGLGKIIAISTHSLDVIRSSIKNPEIHSIMYQVNMANHNLKGRNEALSHCQNNGIGVVAMKPYAGGNLLKTNKKLNFPDYKTGGLKFSMRVPSSMTDVKCLHYTLSQTGVNCLVTGPKNIEELQSSMRYYSSIEKAKSYQSEITEMFSL